MGFSVSGSAAVIFAGMFIAFGMWHTAATNSFERVSEARDDRADDVLDRQNTAIEAQRVTNTSVPEQTDGTTTYHLNVTVTNNGSTSLSVSETNLLFDNDLRTGWESDATVDGGPGTDLWLPGDALDYSVVYDDSTAVPDRVTVATETGVTGSWEVTAA